MEKDRNHDSAHRGKDKWPDSDAAERDAMSKDPYLGVNKDVSGNDEEEAQRDNITHHQQFGNRHYKAFSNHSSADDQPMTDTGA